jgi:hypothetical protein
MTKLLRIAFTPLMIVLCVFGFATRSSAYYYYVNFATHSAPYNPLLEMFDVTALPNNTVSFFVSDSGPSATYPGDSFQAVVSELRTAADVWNQVPTSNIRLAYGGLFVAGTTSSTPSIEVVFSDDIPPGLLAFSGPQVKNPVTSSPNGNFVPIQLSMMMLPLDLSQSAMGPSSAELFFTTVTHEFGHTLGLQHTLTSSVMSTATTSSSSKAAPLGADDIAGISNLYPTTAFAAAVGTISGSVTLGKTPLNLASVVAVPAVGQAISALTNPDGTYQITGLTPGVNYYVYAHPLPPALTYAGETTVDNIKFPVDVNGTAFPPNYTAFATRFYPGTSDPNQAVALTLTAGGVVSSVNFAVSSLQFVPVYGVRVYGYSTTGVAEMAPALNGINIGQYTSLVATGAGLLQNNFTTLTPGLGVQVFQDPAEISQVYVDTGYAYIAIQTLPSVGLSNLGPGPRTLLFSTPNDTYVLPAAFNIVSSDAPWVSSLTGTYDTYGNRAVFISGANLAPDNTRFLFDGLAGMIRQVTADGRFLVIPPPAPAGYTAALTALNSDGQSSLYVQSPLALTTYTYDPGPDSPSLAITPAMVVPGADTTVLIAASGSNPDPTHPLFVDGQTFVGFGTSDVTVKQVTVVDANHLSVVVNSAVPINTSSVNVTAGVRLLSQDLGTSITAQ